MPFERLRAVGGVRRLKRSLEGYEVRPLVGFPEEVEELSKRVEARYGFMVRRDPDYLTWRFQRGRSRLHRCFGVYDQDGEFRGYVVVQLPREGELHGFLVDLLAEGEAAQMPLQPGVAVPEHVTPVDELNTMTVDFAAVGTVLEQRTQDLHDRFAMVQGGKLVEGDTGSMALVWAALALVLAGVFVYLAVKPSGGGAGGGS